MPFSPQDIEWRVVELSKDGKQARLRPQLAYQAVLKRLNDTLGPQGWSNRYFVLIEGVFSCELTIEQVIKSCWMADKKLISNDLLAQDALVYAAEYFGLVSGVKLKPDYWVEYDPEHQTILFEPEPTWIQEVTPAKDLPEKPAGQQAIDKLIERLRQEGQGLEAAKLLIRYGGYGQNPEAAKELYGKLRGLLRDVAV